MPNRHAGLLGKAKRGIKCKDKFACRFAELLVEEAGISVRYLFLFVCLEHATNHLIFFFFASWFFFLSFFLFQSGMIGGHADVWCNTI